MIEIYPADKHQWDALVAQCPYATPFHQLKWCQMATDNFGGTFEIYAAHDTQGLWLIPVFQGLPWLNSCEAQTFCIGYGGPLPIKSVTLGGICELQQSKRILELLATRLGLSNIKAKLYPSKFWPAQFDDPTIEFVKTCKIDVKGNSDLMFNTILSGNVRTAIRKARKCGVVVRELDIENVNDANVALTLLRTTQLHVGSSYQTEMPLFRSINMLKGAAVFAKTYIAEAESTIIGMVVCVYNYRELFHLFHGWDRTYANLCANQALQWSMVQLATSLGLSSYNMGESHTSGIAESKLRWGGHLESIPIISVSV